MPLREREYHEAEIVRLRIYWEYSAQLKNWKIDNAYYQTGSRIVPEITKVFEMSVPPQKNLGGLVPVCINATIHGKVPRGKSCPRTISPDWLFWTPHVSTLLGDRSTKVSEDFAKIVLKAITMRIFLIIAFVVDVKRLSNNLFMHRGFFFKKLWTSNALLQKRINNPLKQILIWILYKFWTNKTAFYQSRFTNELNTLCKKWGLLSVSLVLIPLLSLRIYAAPNQLHLIVSCIAYLFQF